MVLQFPVRDGLKRHNALNQSQNHNTSQQKIQFQQNDWFRKFKKIQKRNPEIKKIARVNLNTRPEL